MKTLDARRPTPDALERTLHDLFLSLFPFYPSHLLFSLARFPISGMFFRMPIWCSPVMLFFLDFWGTFTLRAIAIAVAVAVAIAIAVAVAIAVTTSSLPAKMKQVAQRTLPLLLLLLLVLLLIIIPRLILFPQYTLLTDWLDTLHRPRMRL